MEQTLAPLRAQLSYQAMRGGVVRIALHFQQALRKRSHVPHPDARLFPARHCCHLKDATGTLSNREQNDIRF